MGNVGAVVCLDPTCHEAHELKLVEAIGGERLVQEEGHWWKCCQLCDRRIHADPGAFGAYAICVECFNRSVGRGEWPPMTPW
jgi:hypothetical protein